MASVIQTERVLTAEEYARLPDNGKRTELVRGRVVELNIPYTRHGEICVNVIKALLEYLAKNDIGRVMSNDAAVRTERGPDTVRGADVAFMSYRRRPKGPLPRDRYIDEVPEVVFEVRSSTDKRSKVLGKVAEYLEAGVNFVCVLDERKQTATVYSDEDDASFSTDAELTFPDVLPGFAVKVGRFFE